MSRRYQEARAKVEAKEYLLKESITLIKECANTKFDETVDVALKLGVDPKHANQMVRGSVLLRHGLGKTVRVLVFAKGEKETEALEAGADYAGAEDLVSKISGGWMEFDRVVAAPDMMGLVAKLGRILGPRGLMPNPKLGTVTNNIGKMVSQIKRGQVEYKVNKAGILHAPIGKASFSADKLFENVIDFLLSVKRAKPASSKGRYMQRVSLSSTMGPGVNVSVLDIDKLL